jgi:hypothetical protein
VSSCWQAVGRLAGRCPCEAHAASIFRRAVWWRLGDRWGGCEGLRGRGAIGVSRSQAHEGRQAHDTAKNVSSSPACARCCGADCSAKNLGVSGSDGSQLWAVGVRRARDPWAGLREMRDARCPPRVHVRWGFAARLGPGCTRPAGQPAARAVLAHGQRHRHLPSCRCPAPAALPPRPRPTPSHPAIVRRSPQPPPWPPRATVAAMLALTAKQAMRLCCTSSAKVQRLVYKAAAGPAASRSLAQQPGFAGMARQAPMALRNCEWPGSVSCRRRGGRGPGLVNLVAQVAASGMRPRARRLPAHARTHANVPAVMPAPSMPGRRAPGTNSAIRCRSQQHQGRILRAGLVRGRRTRQR